jgi:hypothetical protein
VPNALNSRKQNKTFYVRRKPRTEEKKNPQAEDVITEIPKRATDYTKMV